MCIAILMPMGKKISEETLKICFANNHDGAGLMYTAHGEVIIDKGFMTVDTFLEAYRKLLPKLKSDLVIHFRISTSGIVDMANCHPHRITKKLAVVHNGILFTPPAGSKESDTAIFCRDILSQLPPKFLQSQAHTWLLENSLGAHNKLIFLDSESKYTIFGEKFGVWHEGCWYSNTTYKHEPLNCYGAYGYDNFGCFGDRSKKGTAEYYAERKIARDLRKKAWECARCGAYMDKQLRSAGSELCWECAGQTDSAMCTESMWEHRLDY